MVASALHSEATERENSLGAITADQNYQNLTSVPNLDAVLHKLTEQGLFTAVPANHHVTERDAI